MIQSGLANKCCRKFQIIRVICNNSIFGVIKAIAGHVMIFDTTIANSDMTFHGTVDFFQVIAFFLDKLILREEIPLHKK